MCYLYVWNSAFYTTGNTPPLKDLKKMPCYTHWHSKYVSFTFRSSNLLYVTVCGPHTIACFHYTWLTYQLISMHTFSSLVEIALNVGLQFFLAAKICLMNVLNTRSLCDALEIELIPFWAYPSHIVMHKLQICTMQVCAHIDWCNVTIFNLFLISNSLESEGLGLLLQYFPVSIIKILKFYFSDTI